MAAPRLPFLWPMLAKAIEKPSPALRSARAAARTQHFHLSSHRRRPDAMHQRYGTANEPLPPHLGGGKGLGPPTKQQTQDETTALPKIGDELQRDGEAEVKADSKSQEVKAEQMAQEKVAPTTVDAQPAPPLEANPVLDASESQATQTPPGAPSQPEERPLESLLDAVPDHGNPTEEKQASTPPPEEVQPEAFIDEHAPPVKAAHINPPQYVHHFDTYGLVRRLGDSEWTEEHAITTMKAVRLMLADNMDLAREALVSKSQVENETYLFRAACAELKTEITARRKSEHEKMRTERTQLQHEVDILSQRLGQESAVLKDELKGMFDDRKMAVRNEQRGMESKVQRLNYQITVDLQADARSEVEGLRWVMTRRVIIALAVVIVMVLGSLKLSSNALHEQELEAKRRANMRTSGTQTNGPAGGDSGNGGNRSIGVGGEMLVQEGDNPAFVSLG